ncbi:MAG: 3-phosphoshikimate 1-carboxyvinyltransferase [Flavobacteriales bacterium]
MRVEVYPSIVKGKITAPGSKSIAQRMMACALLSRGDTTINEYPSSNDCLAALSIAQNLGAIVTQKKNQILIRGGFPNAFQANIRNPKNEINCGESGLSSRMFTPIAALHNDWIEITGEGTLLKRPFGDFDIQLPALGASCETTNGLLPLRVKGPLLGGTVDVDGSISSQYLTGLLFALPKAHGDSIINVKSLTSIPYIEMTLEIMAQFGVVVKHKGWEEFKIRGNQLYLPQNCTVPGDWSSAAFLIVAAAICAEDDEVIIENLDQTITQADASILEVIRLAGIPYSQKGRNFHISSGEIQAFEFDATNCPDLIPPATALAAFANGVSTIRGANRLIHKESNRAKALQEEFGKANVRIAIRDNELKIYPGSIRPAVINSHNDHRIAMAATLLGLGGDKMTIKGAESVNKSFPEFFDSLKQLGAKFQTYQV